MPIDVNSRCMMDRHRGVATRWYLCGWCGRRTRWAQHIKMSTCHFVTAVILSPRGPLVVNSKNDRRLCRTNIGSAASTSARIAPQLANRILVDVWYRLLADFFLAGTELFVLGFCLGTTTPFEICSSNICRRSHRDLVQALFAIEELV